MSKPAFTKRTRLAETSRELDALERGWWDENAALIDRLWTLPRDVREVVRAPLAARIRAFFGPGTILEIGCGSGWLAGMVAGNGIRVVGVDFSQKQVRRARERASAEGRSDEMEFRTADLAEALTEPYDRVLVHASLHHLADDELDSVLARLAEPSGRRVFAYEPTFPEAVRLPATAKRALRKLVHAGLAPRGLRGPLPGTDVSIARALEELVSRSTREGWFFSPKEVPLHEARFLDQVGRRFEVLSAYPVHFWSLHVAQRVGLINEVDRRAAAIRELLKPAQRSDALLFRTGLFRLFEEAYLFFAFELKAR